MDFQPKTTRRSALISSAALGASLGLVGVQSARAGTGAGGTSQGRTVSTPRAAVARTRFGKVRGYVEGDVFTFKGIPYGGDTGGENRWLPARLPEPWEGEFPALTYGPNCPQMEHNFRAAEQYFLQQWQDGYPGEAMLTLNVWTPSLEGNRPVMVYLHGGGFAFGSSSELPSQDGARLARNHDVVQVSVNHRLNVLGFLDLVEVGGDAYAESANVSMTDLVAALRWVRENIRNFGGNPDNVLIYGQSGGGSKVTTLMGMPSAKGLFHRAIVQSGGGGNIPDAAQSRAFSRQVLKELGVGAKDLPALQKLPWPALFEAGNRAAAKINGPTEFSIRSIVSRFAKPLAGWSPTLDGNVVPIRSFFDAAPEISRNVPMIVGNVSEEGMAWASNPDEALWRTELGKFLTPERADALIAAMKRAHPEKSIRTLSYGVDGLYSRNHVLDIVAMKFGQNAAPVYQYLFQWQTPQLDAQPGAWHSAELAFCFDNTQRCAQGTGNTPQAQALAHKMAGAWASFARTGNPSQPGLPWMSTDPVRCRTMIFDNHCRIEDDPEGEARRLVLESAA